MVTKDGQFKTKLPTQYKTNNKKKIIIEKEGSKLNYQKNIKCFVCGKRKMEKYYEKIVEDGRLYKVKTCNYCNYSNYILINEEKKY